MVVRNSYFSCLKIGKNRPPKYGTSQQHHQNYHSKDRNLPINIMNYDIDKKGGKRTRKSGQYEYAVITLYVPTEVKSKMVNRQEKIHSVFTCPKCGR